MYGHALVNEMFKKNGTCIITENEMLQNNGSWIIPTHFKEVNYCMSIETFAQKNQEKA